MTTQEPFRMEQCFDFFGCKKTDCPMFQFPNSNCWETDGTLCNNPCQGVVNSQKLTKETVCKICLYYQSIHAKTTR